jgi:hypothetical protein
VLRQASVSVFCVCVLPCIMEQGVFGILPTCHSGICRLTILFCVLLCLCERNDGGMVVFVHGVKDFLESTGVCFI